MDSQVTKVIRQLADSQRQLASILESHRHITAHAAYLLGSISGPPAGDSDQISGQSLAVTKSVVSYLNGLAELEEAVADQLGIVIKELHHQDDE